MVNTILITKSASGKWLLQWWNDGLLEGYQLFESKWEAIQFVVEQEQNEKPS